MGSHALDGLIAQARYVAQRRSQRASTAHCVLAMLQSDGEASLLLSSCGVTEMALVSALKVEPEEPDSVLERVSERSRKLAVEGRTDVRAVHLLASMAREPRSAAYRCLERLGVSPGRVLEESLLAVGLTRSPPAARPATIPPPLGVRIVPHPSLSRTPSEMPRARAMTERSRVAPPVRSNRRVPSPKARPEEGEPDAEANSVPANTAPEKVSPFALDAKKYPLLASIGTNLTELAAAGAIDPVIGREAELDRLLDVVSRRRGNNPLLVGPPGVGKTALVHALALAIAADDPITRGLDRRIVLEISAGSLVSGTGVRGALAEKLRRLVVEAKSAGDVLLFLDEIHAVIGAGEGPDDLASELKSVLARGELPCIGATTDAEAKKTFDKDPALARRFSTIHIAEPSVKDAIAILRGLIQRYEEHHQVGYRLDAIEAAVELSVRFLPERHLPDKALSVLDLAGARARRESLTVVDLAAVAQVIADEAHVPLERLLLRDRDRLLALEDVLEERVVGQRASLTRIADALRKGAAGFRGRRPLATFLFLGSTGVGKTETAKSIAEAMFGEANVVRFDMSEMSESHSVARLIGAPPGYVGHEAGGQLTEAVRRRPYSLVLLDEIEKAHPEVLLALLPLLDEGRLTDARGRTVDFSNTVVVLTSNLGAAEASSRTSSIGFGARDDHAAASRSLEDRTLAAARRAMPPELWNRLDEPLYFSPITRPDALEIARRMLEKVRKTFLLEHGVELVVEESALGALADAGGFDPSLGARPMRRMVGRLVESPIAARVLGDDVRRGDRIVMRGRGAEIDFEFEEPEEEAAE